jgi:hypothetical protein
MATSPNQEGVEGTDSGEHWIFTDDCVILKRCPPYQDMLFFFLSKETHFSLFYNPFTPFV